VRRLDREIPAALFEDKRLLVSLFLIVAHEFLVTFSTIAKIRFLLAFDTPSSEANVVADFTGNDIVRAFDMNT
jgi:hypothetical protein